MASNVMDALEVTTRMIGYAALRENAAWMDLSARGKIRATGEDRARLLHAMTTNQVETLKPGEGCYAFFLSAQGRILADANLLCFEDHFLLDTEPETRTKVYEHLDRYIIADDVTLEDQTDQIATIAIEGPKAEDALKELSAPIPAAPYSSATWKSGASLVTIARLDTTGKGGFFLLIPAEEKQAVTSRLIKAGFPEATAEDARMVRIENGRPRYGEEITERYLVQETDQLRAVNFGKGCYLGQEIVERVRSRAQIHRGLRRVEIDMNQPPAAGAKLKSGEADAGEIASAAFSPAQGKTVALAYVRSQFDEPGTTLTLDGAIAHVL
jgi:folate-binding protein YgfZ